MRPSLTPVLLLASLASAGPLAAELPAGRGALLPLQDRVGEPNLARRVEGLLERELTDRADLTAGAEVRGVLRQERVRDASQAPPNRLTVVAGRLEVDWFFAATLHEARRGRDPQRLDAGGTRPQQQRFEDAGDTPQVTLSARIFRADHPVLVWAGFEAASGRDREGILGLGTIETLEELLETSVRRLVAEAAADPSRTKPRLRHRIAGFQRAPITVSPDARIAVIPMDSVAELEAARSAEVATAALLAALDETGFEILLPGLVRDVRQESGEFQHGMASQPEWEALAWEAKAAWIATGTVETYRRGVGRIPDPSVAFSVRLLETGQGRIEWLDGLERTGADTASVFDRGRIYSSGDLAHQMMRAIFAKIRTEPASSRDNKEY